MKIWGLDTKIRPAKPILSLKCNFQSILQWETWFSDTFVADQSKNVLNLTASTTKSKSVTNVPKLSSISLLPLQSPNHQCPNIVLNLTASTAKSNSVTNVPKLSSISPLLLQSPNLSPMSQNCPQYHYFYYKVHFCLQCL